MIPGSANPLLLASAAEAAAGYEIERSLRFNSADSAYLNRTPASAGNRKTWTWAGWVKRARVDDSNLECFFACVPSSSNYVQIAFQPTTNYLGLYISNGSGTAQSFSSGTYRDLSSWYHIVISFDSTQSTASNRLKVYVNGAEIAYSTDARSSIAQNTDFAVNSTNGHSISSINPYSATRYFSGYLADVFLIDGQALAPTSFGAFDANGIWQPIDASGLTYGTNGFHLDFSDNSSAAALGYDAAGSNDWTVNNISVTAGAGNDSLVDVPTNGTETDTGVGGEVRGNYATFNPVGSEQNANAPLVNGNLEFDTSGYTDACNTFVSTIAVSSGKWYFEGESTDDNGKCAIGIIGARFVEQTSANNRLFGQFSDGYAYEADGGDKSNNNINTAYGSAWRSSGNIVGCAFDADNGTLEFFVNNVSQGVAYSSIPQGSYYLAIGVSKGPNASNQGMICTFGQRPFAYTAPSGYKALCTANLPSTTITTSGSYTGNGVVDGPLVYLNGVPTAMTVGGNSVTFGTDADKLSNGFKIRTTSTTYNQNASTYNYTITSTGDPFKTARAQIN